MMKTRMITGLFVLGLTAALLGGCGDPEGQAEPSREESSQQETEAETVAETAAAGGYQPEFTDEDLDSRWSEDTATRIVFSGLTAEITGEGAQAVEGGVKISESGEYVLSGVLDDGRIVVDVEPGEPLKLVLNGLQATSSVSAPIYVSNGDAVIVLAAGTENILTDAAEYQYADPTIKEPNACLYGDDNLTVSGTGALTVNGNFNNGIGTKDELKIVSGTITVNAANNALKGNDCVLIRDGLIRLESRQDGIKSDNGKEEGKGLIRIEGGDIRIIVKDDALQAESMVSVTGGLVRTDADGKKVNCDGIINISEGLLE